jgi:hypothetical protein
VFLHFASCFELWTFRATDLYVAEREYCVASRQMKEILV